MSVLLSASAARLQRAPSPCSRTSRSWECVLTAAIRAPDPPALAISCLSWAARLHSARHPSRWIAALAACSRMAFTMAPASADAMARFNASCACRTPPVMHTFTRACAMGDSHVHTVAHARAMADTCVLILSCMSSAHARAAQTPAGAQPQPNMCVPACACLREYELCCLYTIHTHVHLCARVHVCVRVCVCVWARVWVCLCVRLACVRVREYMRARARARERERERESLRVRPQTSTYVSNLHRSWRLAQERLYLYSGVYTYTCILG